MHTTTTITILDNAAQELSASIAHAVSDIAAQRRFAADIVSSHRLGIEERESAICFTLVFMTEDRDVQHIAEIEMTIGAGGTPAGMSIDAYDGTGACRIGGATKEFGVDITVNEAAAITADIVINLLRDYAAKK